MSRRDRGSAGVVLIGVTAAIVLLSGAWLGVSGLFAVQQRAAAVADAAALAAADAASGFAAGEPCALAAEVAAVMAAAIDSCEVTGLESRITASAGYLGLRASARARAGPPQEDRPG
ncbi:hypothetical protein HQQ81_07855 [Microbacteriaceae bacterium VKM Ac-2854]|nr:hypothetical protein [Microbacteriaceae bacterium VKM Ac-2854]